jgi:hypothetical protein
MMDLSGSQGTIKISNRLWMQILDLAYNNGWKPLGVIEKIYNSNWRIDTSSERTMNYSSNNFQIVTADDSANVAAALERAMPAEADYFFEDGSTYKEFLQEFIMFCKAGSFHIG